MIASFAKQCLCDFALCDCLEMLGGGFPCSAQTRIAKTSLVGGLGGSRLYSTSRVGLWGLLSFGLSAVDLMLCPCPLSSFTVSDMYTHTHIHHSTTYIHLYATSLLGQDMVAACHIGKQESPR